MEIATALFSAVGSAASTVGSAVGSALGIGGATAGAAGAAGATAGAAGTVSTVGSTISSILQGTATLLSVSAGMGAADMEANALNLQANDAEREKPLEVLQGIDRRTSIKRAMMDAVGDQNTAYAASGVDLTFGTPTQARQEAFREADLGLETAAGTEMTRIARLDERAANLRAKASATRKAGRTSALAQGLGGFASIFNRG